MQRESKTDWGKVQAAVTSDAPIPYDPEDGPYDPNDHAAVEAYWKAAKVTRGRGPQKAPTKEMISIRLSREVLDYFRASGEGWQSRVDETLKKAIRRKHS